VPRLDFSKKVITGKKCLHFVKLCDMIRAFIKTSLILDEMDVEKSGAANRLRRLLFFMIFGRFPVS